MKRRKSWAILLWPLFLSAFFCPSTAYAQQVRRGTYNAGYGGPASLTLPYPLHGVIVLQASEDTQWPEDPTNLDLSIVFLPSNTRISRADLKSIKYSDPDRRSLLIELSPQLRVPPGDDRMAVSVAGLDAQLPSAAAAEARAAFVREELANYDRQLRHSMAVEKTSEEKSFFSEIQLTAPSGGAGTLGVNKAFNPGFLNQIIMDAHLGKGGNKKADPRYFDAGVSFRKILLGARRARALRELRASSALGGPGLLAPEERGLAESLPLRASTLINAKRKPELFLNYAGLRLETDLKGLRPGPVNNLLYTGGVELRSPRMHIGSGPFYWSYRLTPTSVEAGKNLRNSDDRASQQYGIARLTGIADFKLLYNSPCRYNTLFAGVVFETNFTDRYLLKSESAFDRVTEKSDLRAVGNQYSLKMDLRFVTGLKLPEDLGLLIKPLRQHLKIPKLGKHPAFTVTYWRGGVPPVFAFNNTFKFGFSLESSDEDNTSDLGTIIPHDK